MKAQEEARKCFWHPNITHYETRLRSVAQGLQRTSRFENEHTLQYAMKSLTCGIFVCVN